MTDQEAIEEAKRMYEYRDVVRIQGNAPCLHRTDRYDMGRTCVPPFPKKLGTWVEAWIFIPEPVLKEESDG